MNCRYPESTVIQTYRLSEWSSFLEVAGQLPGDATISDLPSQGACDTCLLDEHTCSQQETEVKSWTYHLSK